MIPRSQDRAGSPCRGAFRSGTSSATRKGCDGSRRSRATLELASARFNEKGHVTVLSHTGIHPIDNVSSKPSYSVHVYGRGIGSLERGSYDPVTGTVSKFVSGYCNVLRDEDDD